MADWGLWSYLVLLFERTHDGSFQRPEHFGRNALVTFSTHDLPTFAGWVRGHDLQVKRSLGMDPGETDEQRHHAIDAMRRALGIGGDGAVEFSAVVQYLASTRTRLLVVSMEDALGIIDQPNVPGTVHEHPNWRRRLPLDLEQLFSHESLRMIGREMTAQGRGDHNRHGTP
jgi:4-alpha-glucanotransferase